MQRNIQSPIYINKNTRTIFSVVTSSKLSTPTRSNLHMIIADKTSRKRYSVAVQSISVIILIFGFSGATYYNSYDISKRTVSTRY